MTEGLPVRTFRRSLRFSWRRAGDAGRCLFLVPEAGVPCGVRDYTSKLVSSLRRQPLGEAYAEVAIRKAKNAVHSVLFIAVSRHKIFRPRWAFAEVYLNARRGISDSESSFVHSVSGLEFCQKSGFTYGAVT